MTSILPDAATRSSLVSLHSAARRVARFVVFVAGLALLVILSGVWTVWPDVGAYWDDSFVGALGSMVLVFAVFVAPELIASVSDEPVVAAAGAILAGCILALRYRAWRKGTVA